MPDYDYKWGDKKTVHWSTRHMPIEIRDKIKRLAEKMDHSSEWVVNNALAIGLAILEKEARKNDNMG